MIDIRLLYMGTRMTRIERIDADFFKLKRKSVKIRLIRVIRVPINNRFYLLLIVKDILQNCSKIVFKIDLLCPDKLLTFQ